MAATVGIMAILRRLSPARPRRIREIPTHNIDVLSWRSKYRRGIEHRALDDAARNIFIILRTFGDLAQDNRLAIRYK